MPKALFSFPHKSNQGKSLLRIILFNNNEIMGVLPCAKLYLFIFTNIYPIRMITHFCFFLFLEHELKIMRKDDETRLRRKLIIVCFFFKVLNVIRFFDVEKRILNYVAL